ncbi:MAG: ISLre2 family transposase [Lachnospiraceae bacterium]
MENIIQQITIELVEKINKKAFSEKLTDLDKLAADIFEDCADYARLMMQEVIRIRNLQFREDKAFRRQEGLVLKEKERPRQILTKLGMIEWNRDYYYDKVKESYVFPLDHMLGIRKYERIGDEVTAQLLSRATEVSFAKSTDIVTGGAVSRQSVHNHIIKANIPEKQPETENKPVKELHVYADEDHVHMQRPEKKRGKQNQIVPLVTVTEGTVSAGIRRNRTIEPMHFVDEKQSSKMLWKSVEGYIAKAYDVEQIDKIYIHGDGGKWIQGGLETFPNVTHAMDGYHFFKELKALARKFPKRNVKAAIVNALTKDDRKRADRFIQELTEKDDEILEFGRYLFGNWEHIRNRIILDIPGSCTEGQVSHVLSERFSRNPMGWSKAGLGKLSKLRVYNINGGKLTGKDLKEEPAERYCEYADRFVKENTSGAIDWSIFEGDQTIMNGNSGTQVLLKRYGTDHGILGGNILS